LHSWNSNLGWLEEGMPISRRVVTEVIESAKLQPKVSKKSSFVPVSQYVDLTRSFPQVRRLPSEIAQSMAESDQGLDSNIAQTADKNRTPDARDLIRCRRRSVRRPEGRCSNGRLIVDKGR
jgi:hypothetical protein